LRFKKPGLKLQYPQLLRGCFPKLHKAVRIIQEEPEPGAPDLGAWLDEIELEEGSTPVPELVIALALSRETAAAARELIRKWVVEDVAREEIVREFSGQL